MNTIHLQYVPKNFYRYATGSMEFCSDVAKWLPEWKNGKPAMHATREGKKYSLWIPRSGASPGGITMMDID